MNKRWIEVVGEGGLHLWRIEYVRSRRKKPVDLDRYIGIVMGLMMFGMSIVLFIATLPRIWEVFG